MQKRSLAGIAAGGVAAYLIAVVRSAVAVGMIGQPLAKFGLGSKKKGSGSDRGSRRGKKGKKGK